MYQHREEDAGKVREQSMKQSRTLQENLKVLVRKTDNLVVDIVYGGGDGDGQLPIINYEAKA